MDSCAAQYKKKASSLYHQKKDLGILAEWHFFTTSYSKGPNDRVGGSTVKWLVSKASLQWSYTTSHSFSAVQ